MVKAEPPPRPEPAEGEEEEAAPPEEEELPDIPHGLQAIAGLEALPSLKTLELSKNLFETLDGDWSQMGNLEALILNDNGIVKLDSLRPIADIPKLKNLEISFSEGKENEIGNVRQEAIILNDFRGLSMVKVDGDEG